MENVQEIIKSWRLQEVKTLFLVRHEEPALDMNNYEVVIAYAREKIDPPLSEEGKEAVKITAQKVPPTIKWFTSCRKRAVETVLILAAGPNIELYSAFDPPDFREVPLEIFNKWVVAGNDNILEEAWLKTSESKDVQQRVILGLTRVLKCTGSILGIVTHKKICQIIMCFFQDLPLDRMGDEQTNIARGEVVKIEITPEGKIEITRITSEEDF